VTASEVKVLLASMMSKWPQAAQRLAGEHVTAEYSRVLAEVRREHAAAAVEAWSRDGEKWPPSAGEVLQTLARLLLDPPEWGQVKAALTGHAPVPADAPDLPVECPYGECDGDGFVIVDWERSETAPCRCRPGRKAILRQRRTRHPLVALFLAEVGTLEIADLLEDRTAEAQCREKWLAFLRGVNREIAYHGLAPAGLPALERVTRAPTLRRGLGAGALRKLDPAALLAGGGAS
jgi:hypothetical protein